MSYSPLPGPPRSRSKPVSPTPNRGSDSSFSPLLRVIHAPLSAQHGHPRTRRALALEQLKLNGALLLIRGFLGYVGAWSALVKLLSHFLGSTGAGVLNWFILLILLILAFNAADAIWALRQMAETTSPAPSRVPTAASAVSQLVQAPIPKPPITPRVAQTFQYPPSSASSASSSAPVFRIPDVLSSSQLGFSVSDTSFNSLLDSPSPSIRAALALGQRQTGSSQSHPPTPIRLVSSPTSLALSSGREKDKSFKSAMPPFTSSYLGHSFSRAGRALDSQAHHRLTS